MRDEKINISIIDGGFCSLLAVVFIALKLCGVINWAWIWVLAPLWIPIAIVLGIIIIIVILGAIKGIIEGIFE